MVHIYFSISNVTVVLMSLKKWCTESVLFIPAMLTSVINCVRMTGVVCWWLRRDASCVDIDWLLQTSLSVERLHLLLLTTLSSMHCTSTVSVSGLSVIHTAGTSPHSISEYWCFSTVASSCCWLSYHMMQITTHFGAQMSQTASICWLGRNSYSSWRQPVFVRNSVTSASKSPHNFINWGWFLSDQTNLVWRKPIHANSTHKQRWLQHNSV